MEYIAIGRSPINVIAKHTDPWVMCNLAWLVSGTNDVNLFALSNRQAWAKYSDMELKEIWATLNGYTGPVSLDRPGLLAQCYTAALNMPPAKINPDELTAQCDYVMQNKLNNGGGWVYVPGSDKPTKKRPAK